MRFDNRLLGDIRDEAAQRGQSLSAVVRQLVATALRLDAEPGPLPDSSAALAALLASELTVLMVASILPDGEARMHELAAQAAINAGERLAGLRDTEP